MKRTPAPLCLSFLVAVLGPGCGVEAQHEGAGGETAGKGQDTIVCIVGVNGPVCGVPVGHSSSVTSSASSGAPLDAGAPHDAGAPLDAGEPSDAGDGGPTPDAGTGGAPGTSSSAGTSGAASSASSSGEPPDAGAGGAPPATTGAGGAPSATTGAGGAPLTAGAGGAPPGASGAGGSGGTGGAAPLTCPANGPAALANKLPDVLTCQNVAPAGNGVMTGCNGWTPGGPVLQGPTQINGSPNGANNTAQLFTWTAADGSLQCLYLARRYTCTAATQATDCPTSGTCVGGLCKTEGLEGLLCFDPSTCEVCAYNSFTVAPNKSISDLLQPTNANFLTPPGAAAPDLGEACSNCHLAGSVMPTSALYKAASAVQDLNAACSKAGGPTWIGAAGFPPKFPPPAPPPVSPNFTQGAKCTNACHTEGFPKVPAQAQATYCPIVAYALTNANGSMVNKNFTAAQNQDCVALMNGIACTTTCGTVCTASATGQACTAAADCCSGTCIAASGTCM